MESYIQVHDLRKLMKKEQLVKVIKAETPNAIYIQFKDGIDEHKELMDYFGKRMERIKEEIILFPDEIKKWKTVAVKEKGQWQRGRVEEVIDFNQINIHLKDTAQETIKTKMECYKLEERFRETPWQIVKCKLAGIEPRIGYEWNERESKMIKYLLNGQQGKIKIEKVINEEEVAVTFTKISRGQEEKEDIGTQLINKGYARRIMKKNLEE